MIHRRFVAHFLITLVLGLAAATSQAQEPSVIPAEILDSLNWRHISPASSGGIFTIVDHGVTWRPVSDDTAGAL